MVIRFCEISTQDTLIVRGNIWPGIWYGLDMPFAHCHSLPAVTARHYFHYKHRGEALSGSGFIYKTNGVVKWKWYFFKFTHWSVVTFGINAFQASSVLIKAWLSVLLKTSVWWNICFMIFCIYACEVFNGEYMAHTNKNQLCTEFMFCDVFICGFHLCHWGKSNGSIIWLLPFQSSKPGEYG